MKSRGIHIMIILILVFMIASCGVSSSDSEDTNQPININYHFDETYGAIAYNSTIDKWHGSIVGAERVSGSSGNALRFGDVGDYLVISILEPGSPGITLENNTINIEADIKFDFLNTSETYHFFGDQIYGLKCFRILVENGNFLLQIFDNNSGVWLDVVISDFPFQSDTWYKISISYNGDEGIISINDVENARDSFISILANLNNDLYLGGLNTSDTLQFHIQPFPGIIDEFLFN